MPGEQTTGRHLVDAARARIARGEMTQLEARVSLFLYRGADPALRLLAADSPEAFMVQFNRDVMADPATVARVERIANG